nr:acyl-CoA dehydrogenase family protein [Lysinibacillus timonensis]
MSEMKDLILDVTERMLKENVSKDLVDILEQGKWSEKLWKLFNENGMTVVAISEKNGGAGGDIDDLLNIVRLTAKYAAPIPLAETTLANILLEYIDLKPTNTLVTFMITDDQSFSIDDQLISGTATNVPWARHAEQLVTLVQGKGGVQLALINLNQATIKDNSNLAGEPRDTVKLNNTQPIYLSPPLGPDQLKHIKKLETAFKLAAITGAIEKVTELTVQYTKEREQFGRPIHRFQLVQQHLVQLAGETAITLTAFNNFTASLLTDNHHNEVAFARLRSEEAIAQVTTIAHQVHAAIGTTHEHPLHHYTRRLWAWRDEGPNSNYWSNLLATDLINNSGDSLWEYLTRTQTTAFKGGELK